MQGKESITAVRCELKIPSLGITVPLNTPRSRLFRIHTVCDALRPVWQSQGVTYSLWHIWMMWCMSDCVQSWTACRFDMADATTDVQWHCKSPTVPVQGILPSSGHTGCGFPRPTDQKNLSVLGIELGGAMWQADAQTTWPGNPLSLSEPHYDNACFSLLSQYNTYRKFSFCSKLRRPVLH